ncbi:MAG: phosphoribosylformylglycinamidine synthase subunit PurQ [Ignavibacteria bacterium]|nr:phosphoribosylformylglycinamidine synthase subunit PurQ [Ignavibacteria bacterium]MBI3765835.1 phosphoribosylformylglycinamidine synthase subunit PurQ [Ignavibacteriales bacterium]
MTVSRPKFGVIVFPGSNCDHDAYYTLKHVLHQDTRFLWHKNSSLEGVDVVILPGGFSYGDYLRCGAIARFSPIMKEVISFARAGGVVLGICNGFQILCEAGLLPGALLRNECLTFVCKFVHVRVEHAATRFTSVCASGEVLEIPIAHGEGNYFADESTLDQLERNNQILFRYVEQDGSITQRANPNGSVRNIAGIVNEGGNVMGLMPHPERASDPVLGHTDGQRIFLSVMKSVVSDEYIHDYTGAERS